MAKTLQDILGWVALTRAVNAVKDGIPNPFPPYLFTVKSEDKVVGDSVKFNKTYGQKKSARIVRYGAPPRLRQMQQEDLVEVKFLHLGEEQVIPPLVMQQLRDYENYDNQMKGMRVVAHNVKTLGTLFGNARIVAVATTLGRGNIYIDSDGNLLPSSSGASETYSQQINSNNIGTVLDNDSTGIFGATGGGSWANASTDIPLQLRRLAEYASMTHGYVPRIALYGKNIPSYMTQNDYVLDYLARNPSMQTEWLKDNTIPDGLFGFTWVPVWLASYTKDNGDKTSLWPADTVTFLPGEEDLAEWWSMFEGSYLVPRSINITTDAAAGIAQMEQVFGAFGYGAVAHKPPSVSTVMGDTFFPAVKNTEAVYIADVVA